MSFLSSIGSAIGAAVNTVSNVLSGGSPGKTGATDVWEYAQNMANEVVTSDRGSTNWAEEIKKPGGLERLSQAALDGNESAKKFIESKEGALAIQLRAQADAQFFQTVANLLRLQHDEAKNAINHIRA